MRVSAAGLTANVATPARGPSIYGITNKGGRLREVGIFNASTTAFKAALQRATAAGTRGTGLTEVNWDPVVNALAAQLTVADTHTADATIAAGIIRQATIGASNGAGVIWTFGDEGIIIPPGTANGLVITCPSGTGQLFEYYFDWDE